MLVTVELELPRGGNPENGIPKNLIMRSATVSEWKSIISSSSKSYKYRALWQLCDPTPDYVKGVKIEDYLHPIDITLMMFYARIATLGPEVGITAVCPNCGHKNSITLDLSTIEFSEYDGIDYEEIVIDYTLKDGTTEKVTLLIESVKEADSLKLYKLAEKTLEDRKKRYKSYDLSLIDVISELLPLYRIKKVNGNSSNIDYFLTKYPSLPMKDYIEISDKGEELDNKVDMLPIKHKCSYCEEEFEVELPRGREVLLYKHTR